MLDVKFKVFQKFFFATKIQNPGVSSLTKVLTQDCLSLITMVYSVFGPVLSPLEHQKVSFADKFQAFPATSRHFQRFPAISRHSRPLPAIFRPFPASSSHTDPISVSFSKPLTAVSKHFQPFSAMSNHYPIQTGKKIIFLHRLGS